MKQLLLIVLLSASCSALAAPATAQRYQIVVSPHLRADTFLLDTQTGRVWRQTTFSNLTDQPTVWEEMLREDNPLGGRGLTGKQLEMLYPILKEEPAQ